jgi:16S rRNA (cytosine967-C5)-methyltransferase
MKQVIQMQRAKEAIEKYDGSKALAIYLKQFFREHKEMGSRDRRMMQSLVYHYFRLNRALSKHDTETRIALAHMLCSADCDDFISFWAKEKGLNLTMTPNDFAANLAEANKKGFDCKLENQFPEADKISAQINKQQFLLNHVMQPYTWIRCKKAHTEKVKNELKEKSITFHTSELSANAIGFEQHINFDTLDTFNKGFFEVQDLSSQLTGNFYKPKQDERWWDCCAASGGKSLLLKDMQQGIYLTVSDSRISILNNLKERFKKAGVGQYESHLIDFEKESLPSSYQFDGIILDAPCTGSGTWSRNPERMTYFKPEEIATYVAKQKMILSNVSKKLKPGGKLVYITCSVFEQENENIINASGLKIETTQYLKGYGHHADTMFVGVGIKVGS